MISFAYVTAGTTGLPCHTIPDPLAEIVPMTVTINCAVSGRGNPRHTHTHTPTHYLSSAPLSHFQFIQAYGRVPRLTDHKPLCESIMDLP